MVWLTFTTRQECFMGSSFQHSLSKFEFSYQILLRENQTSHTNLKFDFLKNIPQQYCNIISQGGFLSGVYVYGLGSPCNGAVALHITQVLHLIYTLPRFRLHSIITLYTLTRIILPSRSLTSPSSTSRDDSVYAHLPISGCSVLFDPSLVLTKHTITRGGTIHRSTWQTSLTIQNGSVMLALSVDGHHKAFVLVSLSSIHILIISLRDMSLSRNFS